jgi:hypothetical protein
LPTFGGLPTPEPAAPVGDLSVPSDGFIGLPSRNTSDGGEDLGSPPPLETAPAPGFSGDGGTTPGGLPLWQPTFVPAAAEADGGDLTSAGLTRRERPVGETGPAQTGPTVTSSRRSPEEVRQMLSRYRGGLKKGRTAPAQDDSTTHESSPTS